jgi:hypothetical protein
MSKNTFIKQMLHSVVSTLDSNLLCNRSVVLHRKRSESYNLLIGKRDIKAHVGNVWYLMKTCYWFNK